MNEPTPTHELARSPEQPSGLAHEALPDATPKSEQEPARLLDIHPPHQAAHTWKDFFIHIATICIGLLIAISLEQTVEMLHQRHQRRQLREQMREEFQSDLRNDEFDFQQLAEFRAYLVELRSAVIAKRIGKPIQLPLSATEARRRFAMKIPSMAAWEAAKENASIALLPSDEIRIYNRVELQHSFILARTNLLSESAFALQSFEERFVDSSGTLELGDKVAPADIFAMGSADLLEYEKLLAQTIKATDYVAVRIRVFDSEDRVVLQGVRSEQDLLARAIHRED